MTKVNFIKEQNVLNEIINIIINLHPLTKPRILLENLNSLQSEIEINFKFLEQENKRYTKIIVLDGSTDAKNSTDCLVVENIVSKKILKDLFYFILSEFNITGYSFNESSGFTIDFCIPMEKQDQKGISCSYFKININSNDKNLFYLVEEYLKYLFNYFNYDFSNTISFKNDYSEYLSLNKEKAIKSLTEEEIKNIISMLSTDELRNLLLNMPNSLFIKLINSFDGSNFLKSFSRKL